VTAALLAAAAGATMPRGPEAFLGIDHSEGATAAVDLSADPGSWLVRVLLSATAPRLALLVPNNHPDLANASAQRALTTLFASTYRLRLRRSTPGPRHAIVEADRIDPATLDPPDRVVRAVLDRAHGKVTNTWREALIQEVASSDAAPRLTRNEARARLRATVAAAFPQWALTALDERLIDLPRHLLDQLVAAIRANAAT
jgi:hypothetical protein